jgi:NAD(P)-dependent dehydrogenase (short-subunit alcohol dehydrogenase family)
VARRWLVTGCSSGLGRAVAEELARAGDRAVVTARDAASLADLVQAWPENLVPVAMDLRDEQQCQDAVNTAVAELGGIDVLVNNAGSGLFGAVEEVSDEELREQFESLVFGPWRLVRLVLPTMRAQRAGHIVNVSTGAVGTPVPGISSYLSGKQALEGMSLSLAAEVAAFGIRVTVMQPGAYSTNYGNVLRESATRMPEYADVYGMIGIFRGMADNPELGRPEEYARTLLGIVDAAPPTPLRIPTGPASYEMLGAALHEALDGLDSARALTSHDAELAPDPVAEPA